MSALGTRLREAFSPVRNVRALFVPEPGREPALDGIRAIAILWVICLHGIWTRGLAKYPRDVYRAMLEDGNPVLRIMLRGDLGVDVFFALSGFLIGSILVKERAETGTIALGRFYWRRYLRLTPVYVAVVLLFCTNAAFPNRERVWANLLYVNNFVTQHRQCMPWTWSLAVEEQFYLTLPLVLLFLYRRRTLVVPGLVALLAVGLVVRLVIVLAYDFRFPMAPLMGNPQYDVMWDVIYVKPYARYGCFLPGVVAAHLHVTRRDALGAWLARTATWLAPLVALVTAVLVYAPIFDPSVVWSTFLARAYMVGYAYAFGACVAYFVVLTLHRAGPGRWLSRFLSLRIFTPIAQLSYATYLVHQAFAWVLYLKLRPPPATGLVDHLPYIARLAAFSFGVAALLHLLVERPIMNLRPRSTPQRDSTRSSPTGSPSSRS